MPRDCPKGLAATLTTAILMGCFGPDAAPQRDGGQIDADTVEAWADGAEEEIARCPAGEEFWAENGICAPLIPGCQHHWEIPLISGSDGSRFDQQCVVIGPRACPDESSSDGEPECEVGTLNRPSGKECPPGLGLTHDALACVPDFDQTCGELEIPNLGGGCQRVGPSWFDSETAGALAEATHFGQCPNGMLALEDGLCAHVGPRGCPLLWNPDSDVQCEIDELLQCPEGWQESGDKLYCHPGYGRCNVGERALVGGGCEPMLPSAEQCPAGPFPVVPEGESGSIIYVSATSLCQEQCGSHDFPFPSIAAAVEASPDGGIILVGPGTYDEGVVIRKSLQIRGLCAAKVRIAGAVVLTPEESKVPRAGVAVLGTEDVALVDLGISSEAAGVVVSAASNVLLQRLELDHNSGHGIYAGPGSDIAANSIWVHNPSYSEDTSFSRGHGVFAREGAKLHLSDSLIDSARGAAISAGDETTSVRVVRTEIRNTYPLNNGAMGTGILVINKAHGHVEEALLQENSSDGIWADNATITVARTLVRDTRPDKNGEFGWGLTLTNGALASVTESVLSNNSDAGIAATGSGTKLELSGSAVIATVSSAGGTGGRGIDVSVGAQASILGTLVDYNKEGGVAVMNTGSTLSMAGSVVSNTQPNSNGKMGFGVAASEEATLALRHTLIRLSTGSGLNISGSNTHADVTFVQIIDTQPLFNLDNQSMGILVTNAASAAITGSLVASNNIVGVGAYDFGTQVAISGSEVSDVGIGGSNQGCQMGLYIADGATISLSDSTVKDNCGAGILLTGTGTAATLADSVVMGTRPDARGVLGIGTIVQDGAAAVIGECIIEDNTEIGLQAKGVSTTVEMAHTLIGATRPDSKDELGFGAQAEEGALLLVSHSLFLANYNAAIISDGPNTRATIYGTAVADTKADLSGNYGFGIQARNGSTLEVDSSIIRSNTNTGASALDPGTTLHLNRTQISDTLATTSSQFGRGAQIRNGATALVSYCDFRNNRDVGFVASGENTRIDMVGTVIRGTLPGQDGLFGRGINISDKASASIDRCLFQGNSEGGVVAHNKETVVDITNTIIGDTLANGSGQHGQGIVAGLGASVDAHNCLIVHNATSGVFVVGGGHGQFSNTVIRGTDQGGAGGHLAGKVFGDGAVVSEGTAEFSSCLFFGNARAGVFFNAAAGALSGSLVTRNASFGLALKESKESVVHREGGNIIGGNLMDPQVTEAVGELQVPPAPKALEEIPNR